MENWNLISAKFTKKTIILCRPVWVASWLSSGRSLLFSSGSPEYLQSQVQMNNKKVIMTLPIIIKFTEGFLCAGHSQIYSVTSQMSLIKQSPASKTSGDLGWGLSLAIKLCGFGEVPTPPKSLGFISCVFNS